MSVYRKGNKEDITKNNVESDKSNEGDFNDIVSEGVTVVLDAQDLIKSTDIDSVKDFSWKQTVGPKAVIQSDNRSRTFSFVAPYVRGKDLSSRLGFELTADYDVNKSIIYTANIMVKRVQRAVIFQGGVALGAYEAGVFRALVEKITEEDSKRGLNERPLFDIIAGTSIGAMNASIIASHIINENGSWDKEIVEQA